MRIIVSKDVRGISELTIVPSKATRMPPVVVRGSDRTNVLREAGETIAAVSAEEKAKRGDDRAE